jgi:hypothetical protein
MKCHDPHCEKKAIIELSAIDKRLLNGNIERVCEEHLLPVVSKILQWNEQFKVIDEK